MKRVCEILKNDVLGLRGSKTAGSDARRFSMRMCLYWSIIYGVWAFAAASEPKGGYSVGFSIGATALLCASLLIFVQVVLLMPFRDGTGFVLDARRLLLDTMISSVFMITAFSLIYRNVGLIFAGGDVMPNALDALYFSSVTFSTLGYGDFSPRPELRMIAAMEALIGNLHLGMIVGSTFAAIRR